MARRLDSQPPFSADAVPVFGSAVGSAPSDAQGAATTQEPELWSVWDGLADFKASQTEAATQYLLAELCRRFSCDHAAWVGAVCRPDVFPGDPLGGWRTTAPLQLVGAPAGRCTVNIQERPVELDPLTAGLLRGVGRQRAQCLSELVGEEWLSAAYAELDDPADAIDGVFVACPLTARAESWFVFTRGPHLPRFQPEECAVLGSALRGLRWFHRRLLLWHGILPAQALLTNTERRVLSYALDGATDKELASRTELSLHTTREHMAALYRKFGVASRAELLALWIGGTPGGHFPFI
jgi:DNA-binding CsgD family transcriptional regulator